WIGRRKYRVHNTNLGDNVAHAYQARGIDERRRFFAPTIWRREVEIEGRLRTYGIDRQVIEQTWFAGVHSNVGGGYPDTGLSDLAFVWMAKRAARHGLALDEEHVKRRQEDARYRLVESRTLKWRLTPAKLRRLCVTDASERVHCSAVSRLKEDPPPFEPRPYESANLKQLVKRTGDKFKDLIDWD